MKTLYLLLLATIAFAQHEEEHDHDHRFDEQDGHDHHKDDVKEFAKKDPSEMDEQELQFYMFKQHDMDADDMLDGVELYHNVQKHYNEKLERYRRRLTDAEQENDSEKAERQKAKIDETVREMEEQNVIESVNGYLRRFDKNDNGYIDFHEYSLIMYPDKKKD